MKKTLYLLLVLSLPIFFLSCGSTKVGKKLKQSTKHLILKVDPTIIGNDAQLQGLLTNVFGRILKTKVTIEGCSCGDKSLKLVTFGSPIPDFVLHTKLNALNNDETDGVEGDLQYFAKLREKHDPIPNFRVKTESNLNLGSYFSTTPSNIVIAILDSGIDLSNHFENKKILYPNPNELNCGSLAASSGWNFANDNGDIQDDYTNVGHGTLVAKTLTEKLDAEGVGYQLLPMKIADNHGKVSYWDVICAMSYIKQIQNATNNKIKVVNMSFGINIKANRMDQMRLLGEYIEEMSEGFLAIASAGNSGTNTDNSVHIPSGYTFDNIIAVGGYSINSQGQLQRHPDSNYGKNSIDVAAPYIHSAPGTSFGTAYVSAFIAKLFADAGSQHIDPIVIKETFLSNMTQSPRLMSEFKNGRYVE